MESAGLVLNRHNFIYSARKNGASGSYVIYHKEFPELNTTFSARVFLAVGGADLEVEVFINDGGLGALDDPEKDFSFELLFAMGLNEGEIKYNAYLDQLSLLNDFLYALDQS